MFQTNSLYDRTFGPVTTRVRWTAAAVPRRVSRLSRLAHPSRRMSFTWTDVDIATITYRTNGGRLHLAWTERRRVCTHRPSRCYVSLFSGNLTPTHSFVTLAVLNRTPSQCYFPGNLTSCHSLRYVTIEWPQYHFAS